VSAAARMRAKRSAELLGSRSATHCGGQNALTKVAGRVNELRQDAEVKGTAMMTRANDNSTETVLDPGSTAAGKPGWKRRLRRVLLRALWVVGLLRLWRFVHRHHVAVLMIHGVMEDDGQQKWRPLRSRLPLHDLDRCLAYLARWHTFVSSDEAVEMLAGRAPMRPHSLVITFDDGYRNNLSHALPILRKYGAPATIFVATGHIDHPEPFWFDRLDYALQHGLTQACEVQVGSKVVRLSGHNRRELEESYRRLRELAKRHVIDDEHFHRLMDSLSTDLEAGGGRALGDIFDGDDWSAVATWDEIAALSGDGVIFGSHTVNHVRLFGVRTDVVRAELAESRQAIERHTRRPCRHLAYPNGAFNDAVVDVARALGYAAAFTTEEGLNRKGDDLLRLRRIHLASGLNRLELYASVSGFSDWMARIKIQVLGIPAALGRGVCGMLKGQVHRGESEGEPQAEHSCDPEGRQAPDKRCDCCTRQTGQDGRCSE
jgi:peptidoglycan/xylan/chitin deacetylase (PgdA/CDA1 family)